MARLRFWFGCFRVGSGGQGHLFAHGFPETQYSHFSVSLSVNGLALHGSVHCCTSTAVAEGRWDGRLKVSDGSEQSNGNLGRPSGLSEPCSVTHKQSNH